MSYALRHIFVPLAKKHFFPKRILHGVNRIDEFSKNCTLNGWLVNEIDVQTRVDINKKVNEDIELE